MKLLVPTAKVPTVNRLSSTVVGSRDGLGCATAFRAAPSSSSVIQEPWKPVGDSAGQGHGGDRPAADVGGVEHEQLRRRRRRVGWPR